MSEIKEDVAAVAVTTTVGAAAGLATEAVIGGVGVAALGTAAAVPLAAVGAVVGLGAGLCYVFGKKS